MNERFAISDCGCGHHVCTKVFIEGLTHDGRFERAEAGEIVRKLETHDALVAEHEAWARQFGRALVLFLQGDPSAINALAHDMPLDFVDGEPQLRSAALSAARGQA